MPAPNTCYHLDSRLAMQRVGDLEIDQDLRFENAEWRAERAAWALMSLIILAAILGLFGSGVLNRSEAYGEGIKVRYPRFGRVSSPTALEVTVAPALVKDGVVQVWLPREYAVSLEITSAIPPPETGTSTEDRVVYAFRAKPGVPANIVFQGRFAEGTMGFLTARIGIISGGEANFWQFVWP